MPFLDRVPNVERCCGCVTDLKTAAAIIAVLGIVTSPIVSWVIVRHAYVIRVTCVITTNSTQPDVVDISLNNALSFGFGANAGLGPSCLSRNRSKESEEGKEDNSTEPGFVQFVRYSGWIVLLADIAFLVMSIHLLIKIFKGPDKKASLYFIVTGLISVTLSFIYGMMYVTACVSLGNGFPVYEFFFAGIDLIMWIYYLIVVYSYRRCAT